MADMKAIKLKLWQQRFNIGLWSSFSLFCFFIYHVFSDGDFSFLLTLGGMVRMFALCLITVKIHTHGEHAAGVSAKTLQLYCLTFFFRLCSILFYEGYLPFDKSGDWFYQLIEILSFVISIVALALIYGKYRATYNPAHDRFGALRIPNEFGILYILVPCFILSTLFHPSLNSNLFTDIAWTMAMCVEAVAIMPQLVVFQKNDGGIVEFYTSHFVAALGLARLFSLLFWLSSYHELNDKYATNVTGGYVGHFVVGSQVVQLLLMCDYFYYYIKAMRKGGLVQIPTSADNQV